MINPIKHLEYLLSALDDGERERLRTSIAYHLAPAIQRTGATFSKDYRHGTTPEHALFYQLIDTVGANLAAQNEVQS